MLGALAAAPGGATVAELAAATELDRAVLYRLLDTLCAAGFVVRDADTRRFKLGVALVELGMQAARGLEVRRHARPGMRALVEQCGETVCLAVRDRADVVVADRVEPPRTNAANGYHVGARLALRTDALGHALLANLEDGERAVLLGRQPGLAAALDECRTRGFAVTEDGIERGTSAVAAAIVGRSGSPVASVGIVAAPARLPDPSALGPLVRTLAGRVSASMGSGLDNRSVPEAAGASRRADG